ncbi:MAG: hypothetical protein AB9869_16700 [Verrucomicrobiia bacterium]
MPDDSGAEQLGHAGVDVTLEPEQLVPANVFPDNTDNAVSPMHDAERFVALEHSRAGRRSETI